MYLDEVPHMLRPSASLQNIGARTASSRQSQGVRMHHLDVDDEPKCDKDCQLLHYPKVF